MAKRKRKIVDIEKDPYRGQGKAQKLSFIGNIPTEETFQKLYERYKKSYDAAKGKLRSGEKMYLLRRNYAEFKDFYISVANETEESSTPAATANKIITQMVEESRYEYSYKQARAYTKALERIGIEADRQSVREGKHDTDIHGVLEEIIAKRGKELMKEGKSGYQIKHQIGVEFFDSPT